jgi:hypothetical protein
MTPEIAQLINTLNKISINYTVFPNELCYNNPTQALKDLLIENGIDYELMPSGLYISFYQL